jgi:diaminopimelate decarboxylase
VNEKGHLEIGGCDVFDLAKEFGTPLYIMDENDVRAKCRIYKKAFKSKYPNSDFIFASKALCVTGLLKMINEEGFGVDVSSGGELFTAIKAGVDRKKIYFHGNNKSMKEIEEGLTVSIGRFVADNFDELERLNEATKKKDIKANVLIRVNPGVEAHTHDSVKTGQADSKFGILKDKVIDAVKLIGSMKNVRFVGLHAHIGSQIFDAKGFLSEVDVLIDLARDIKDKLNIQIEELNIGGGIGIAYIDSDDPLKVEDFAEAITKKVQEKIGRYKLAMPKLIIEPGRSIVGRAGVTLYTVGSVKDIPGIRKYVIVDGGMSDNIRPMLYGAKYEFVKADNVKAERTDKVTIAGRFCESGDVLANIRLPKVEKGDLLAVLCTGAYNYSMASNYNRVPRPAMIIVKNGKAKIILKRESYEDITSCDII